MTWWIDAGAGASGDMLLAAMLALDPDGLEAAQEAVDTTLARLRAPGRVRLEVTATRRAGIAATRALVRCDDDTAHRTWADIRPALAGLPAAETVFAALAEAEAAVHGVPVADIHFHEVGALDAIADIVGAVVLCERLAPGTVVVSPVCVGSGSVDTGHGRMSVPGPAVAHLLRGVPTFAGDVAHEACTPTGAALLRFLATEWGPQPAMTVTGIGVGAGGRDTAGQPNVLRILAGSPGTQQRERLVLVETTIDDLDPRLYPEVLAATRTAGALDAWLTPVVLKHGRPGVVITALAGPADVDAVTSALFRETTTLGVRHTTTDRTALDRDFLEVEVDGNTVAVKRGWLDGSPITVQPEYQDVVRAARASGRPVREVLREAGRRASENVPGKREVRTPPTGETATSEHPKT